MLNDPFYSYTRKQSPKDRSKIGGLCYVTSEAGFEAEAYDKSRTGGWTGRVVFVAGGWRNDGNRWTGGEYAHAGDGAESRNYSR
jgi:hypothetical protein